MAFSSAGQKLEYDVDMIALLIAIAGVAACLYGGEVLQHRYDYHPEITRKFVHISVATFAAFWPFFMSWSNIELLSLMLFVGVLASKRLSFFRSIHDVKRLTWGEIFYPVSIGMAALLSGNEWIFTAAMLHLGLADGLAAVVGTLFGRKHQYKVLGATKSRAGTITFWVCSFLIVLVCGVLNGPHNGFITLLWLPLLATAFENIGVAGSDNLLVPMLIVITL
jgi:phytol kinase